MTSAVYLAPVGTEHPITVADLERWKERIRRYPIGYTTSSRDELLWRLNTSLQGRDPGQPVNWKGL